MYSSDKACNLLQVSNDYDDCVFDNDRRPVQWIGSVQTRNGNLAASEAKVVVLLLTGPLFVGVSTTSQFVACAGVSPSSVIRAVRAIGFTEFTEPKIEIARARGATRFFAPPEVLTADATLATVQETSIRTGTDALTAFDGALELPTLDTAVGSIQHACQVIAFGAALRRPLPQTLYFVYARAA